jgi:hypothetical protein
MPKMIAEPIDDEIPTYSGLAGAVRAAKDLGFPGPLTEDIVRQAMRRGEIRPRVIHNGYWFSKAMVRDWLINGNRVRTVRRKS